MQTQKAAWILTLPDDDCDAGNASAGCQDSIDWSRVRLAPMEEVRSTERDSTSAAQCLQIARHQNHTLQLPAFAHIWSSY